MSEEAFQKLQKVVVDHGLERLDDWVRWRGLLSDYFCGEHKRELRALVFVVELRCLERLQCERMTEDAILLPQLAQRLHDELGLDVALAAWAVRSWAVVVGRSPAVEVEPPSQRLMETNDAQAQRSDLQVFENSLGIKFVLVPEAYVFFSVWDTRGKDFLAYVEASGYRQKGGINVWDRSKWVLDANASWWKPGFTQTADHPVVGVSWLEAIAFCQWLTAKERSEGRIASDSEYRLPTDAEWSVAVGSGIYPWGNEWPPPKVAGNYAHSLEVDTYEYTSPVGSFPANSNGLYDMGGNVWQWCEDWYSASMNESTVLDKYPGSKDDGGGKTYRVVRGASWRDSNPDILLSSNRSCVNPYYRDSCNGFRCVLGSLR